MKPALASIDPYASVEEHFRYTRRYGYPPPREAEGSSLAVRVQPHPEDGYRRATYQYNLSRDGGSIDGLSRLKPMLVRRVQWQGGVAVATVGEQVEIDVHMRGRGEFRVSVSRLECAFLPWAGEGAEKRRAEISHRNRSLAQRRRYGLRNSRESILPAECRLEDERSPQLAIPCFDPPSSSGSVPAPRRDYIFWRDGGICHVCGLDMWSKPNLYWVGHIVDSYIGGSDRATNLVTQCESCNYSKPTHETKGAYLAWHRRVAGRLP